MQLKSLLREVPVESIHGATDLEIKDFHFDSRKIEAGGLFIAIVGTQADGHTFIEVAIRQGAHAVICETLPSVMAAAITYVVVSDSQTALAQVAANYFGNPADKLTLIGITGTNGKTSIATLMHSLFNEMGYMSGLVSTIQYMVGKEVYPASHTTPDPRQLHSMFAEMVETGCEYCLMEVSSHALVQQRTRGIAFRMAVFTNITHDHLDYHGTFAEYIKAKKKLFDNLKPEAQALINLDDRNGRVMVQNCKAEVKTYALKRMADYKARILENTFEGLQLEIDQRETWFRVLGSFNAYNLLAAYAAAVELGLDAEEVLKRLSMLPGVEGRFQAIRAKHKEIMAIVDYAHTPDALKNVLETIKDVNQARGKVITVVGCGGNRDQEKRPKMAKIASQLSDQVILTSDNPRFESPADILKQMERGVELEQRRKILTIENRKEAIKVAAKLAQNWDIILIAGKGHETYQEIEGVRYPFDDRQVIREAFHESGDS